MAEQPTDPRPFGFTVKRAVDIDTDQPIDGSWQVHLPHQCGTWDIAGEGDFWSGVPHAEAVADLERFIAEAQAALEALRAEQPYGDPNA
jgi:hypothetical protein